MEGLSGYLILNYVTKIELEKLRQNFKDGKYSKIKKIKKNEILTEEEEEKEITMKEKITTDITQNTYVIKEKGVKKVIRCNNQYVYTYFEKHGKYPDDLICCRCKEKVSTIWGIPLRKTVVEDTTIYHIHNVYHSNSCAYEEYLKYYRDDFLFSDSDRMMREINLRLLGTSEIAKAKNVNLLEINNGSLTRDEYDSNELVFSDPTIEYFPIRMKFTEI